MQDKYVGDIGDFGKYGLLRWLCGVTGADDGPRLTLGVHWYLFDGKDPAQNHGSITAYLRGKTEDDRRLLACDPDLARLLHEIVETERSVAAIERSGALPRETRYFHVGLNFDDLTPHQFRQRRERREDWNQQALRQLVGQHVVFLDPDNGLEVASHSRTSRFGPKYVFDDELIPYWERGQSLIIYQHFDRDEQLIEKKSARLRDALRIAGSPGEIIALHFHRILPRVFFVIPNPRNLGTAQLLRDRVQSFMKSEWGKGGHFTRVDC